MNLSSVLAALAIVAIASSATAQENKTYTALQVDNFAVTGDGSSAAWVNVPFAGGTPWLAYNSATTALATEYQADFKMAYSTDTLYVLIKRDHPTPVFVMPPTAYTFSGTCDAEIFISNNTNTAGNHYQLCGRPTANPGISNADFYAGTTAPTLAGISGKFNVTTTGFTAEYAIPFANMSDTAKFDPTIGIYNVQIAIPSNLGASYYTRWSNPGVASGGFVLLPWGKVTLGQKAAVSDWSQF